MPATLDGARILVTGGAGFIGSNFVRNLLGQFPSAFVVVLDALTYAGQKSNLKGMPKSQLLFLEGDICDVLRVQEAMADCDYVVNFAAESHVDRSIDQPGLFVQTNVYGVFILAEVAQKLGVRRFIQVSTDEVYGEVLEGHASEEAPIQPRSPYAASKASADQFARAYFITYGLPMVVTRCSNNYGPRQYPEKLIPLFVTNALDDQPLPVYGTGLNRRDWLHVDDHCAALISLLVHDVAREVEGEIFNIGGGKELDVLTITDTLLDLLGKPRALVRHVEDRPGHDRRYAVDSAKLTRLTGWMPKMDFAKGIRQTVEWYRANEAWWRPIKSGEFRKYYKRMYGNRRVLKELSE
jgi:dTDP-glucose 4,6-dehydratase